MPTITDPRLTTLMQRHNEIKEEFDDVRAALNQSRTNLEQCMLFNLDQMERGLGFQFEHAGNAFVAPKVWQVIAVTYDTDWTIRCQRVRGDGSLYRREQLRHVSLETLVSAEPWHPQALS